MLWNNLAKMKGCILFPLNMTAHKVTTITEVHSFRAVLMPRFSFAWLSSAENGKKNGKNSTATQVTAKRNTRGNISCTGDIFYRAVIAQGTATTLNLRALPALGRRSPQFITACYRRADEVQHTVGMSSLLPPQPLSLPGITEGSLAFLLYFCIHLNTSTPTPDWKFCQ